MTFNEASIRKLMEDTSCTEDQARATLLRLSRETSGITWSMGNRDLGAGKVANCDTLQVLPSRLRAPSQACEKERGGY